MNDMSDEELKAVIVALRRALRLPVRDDNYPVVEAHLRVAFRMAELVESFDLPDSCEPAPVFSA